MIKLIRILLLSLTVSLIALTSLAQTGTLKGTITDKKSGETLPGVNIIVQGTTIGVASDIDGNYVIDNVPAGQQTILASFIGFESVSNEVMVEAGKSLTLDFSIGEDMMMLDELVVVGYGTKRKRDITSSISKISMDELQEIPVTNLENALQGRAAGVQVTQDNGMAGAPVTIRIRGTSSLATSAQPLYVVDGVPIVVKSLLTSSGYPDKSNALNLINPNDIESIEVLKDASAAAIYGSRGANGVVLITTKKGKAGKTKFDVSYTSGISEVTHVLDVLDGPGYLQASKEAWFNSSMGTEEDYYQNLPFGLYNNDLTYEENKQIIDNTNTDWINTMLRTGFQQDAAVSASGGNQYVTYYGGLYYNDTKGIIVGNDFKRLGVKVSLDIKASKKVRVGGNLNYTNRQYVNVPTGWAGGLGTAQSRSLPIMPIYNADGTYFAPRSGVNVVADYEDRQYKAWTNSLLGNIYFDYQIIPQLRWRTEFGLNNISQRERKYEGTITREEANATDRRLWIDNWTTNNTLSYDQTFAKKHRVTAMIGQSYQKYSEHGLQLFGESFPNPSLQNPTSTPKDRQTASGWEDEWAFLSYFGRFGYAFNDKYLFSFSVRTDGSSKFGPNKKWGTFPAASVGWIITEESWLQDSKWLSFLKLRGSYGQTGNSEFGTGKYWGTYYVTEYNGLQGIGISQKENFDLHWEVSTQYDIGLDFGLWSGRLAGGFDYYYRKTTDMLLNINIPATSGFTTVWDNVGVMDNKGWEVFLTSFNFVNKFKWKTELNFSRNKNNIIDIQGQVLSGLDVGGNYGNNYAQEGHPIGAWRLVEWLGVDPETGLDLFRNQETGEATTEYNFERDKIVVGDPYPNFFGGINNTFEYAGFDLGIFFSFATGQDVYRDDGKFFEGGNLGSNWNQMSTVLNAWKQPGDVASQSKLLWDSPVSTYNTTKYLNDASYLRLKSLTFGYTLSPELTAKLKMNRVRIFFTATNLWTLTDYAGWDPEVNRDFGSSNNVTQGTTYLSPPQAKTFNVGINLSF